MQRKTTPGLRQRGSSWEAYVWDPAAKRKIRETFATRAAAQNWLIDNRKAVKDGKLRTGDNKVTVSAWLSSWLDEKAPQDASEDVVKLYRQSVEDHIEPVIGHLKWRGSDGPTATSLSASCSRRSARPPRARCRWLETPSNAP